MRHWLKTWPPFFQAVFDNVKTFEVRRDDRGFAPGDTLYLQEYHPANGYTGRLVGREVTYILRSGEGDFGIEPGFVVMGLRKIHLPSLNRLDQERAEEPGFEKLVRLYGHNWADELVWLSVVEHIFHDRQMAVAR